MQVNNGMLLKTQTFLFSYCKFILQSVIIHLLSYESDKCLVSIGSRAHALIKYSR